jgi:hypothetical protein
MSDKYMVSGGFLHIVDNGRILERNKKYSPIIPLVEIPEIIFYFMPLFSVDYPNRTRR